ncbi:PAS sensor protein [Gemmatirosa kalamazoonensis]|uniref:histidine kinase n=1 Tax=Gemmatirosa kalamazoonensis TaxID=861299 RepID=W0RJ86_9BACT|nr:ATP-binding protein [Gemmatirosa kalamazoonensis]AHG91159.1 PAS sensor protein [Gemmatirosa kalamazoonensis]
MPLSPLQALTDLAARLAGAVDLDAAMPDVLESARAALGARRCAVWLTGPDGTLAPRWGDAPPDAPSAHAVPLRAGGEVLGTFVVDAAPAAGDGVLSPGVVADVLAPSLAYFRGVREVEEQRRFVARVVDSLPVGLYVIDRDYRVQLWNRKRETDTTGVAREDALGRSIFDVLPRQNAEVLRREFDEAFATGRLQQFQIESRSTGELRTYRLTKIPMAVDGGGPSHVITLGEDITEWKAALERTAQAEKLAAIGQLAAGVMHEINNPLATIAACAETMTLGIAELPPSRPAPPGFGEYLRIIDHEVHRCRGITEGLLNFSRAKPLQRVSVGLNSIVEQTLFLLKHHARFKRYPVRLELAEGAGPQVTADPDQLTQVLMALLLNAADAIGEPAADHEEARGIMLRTGVDGADAFVDVADQGHGIAREELTKIFEPFYTTKPPGAGTGLGLSICYGIVRDHGGRIEVDSALGVGTTFRVLLPAAS